MSNFVIGVGGSGSKYIQSLIHLGAAGLLPVGGRDLDALIVDPDENNGNLQDCKEVERAFQNCKSQLRLGECELFSADIALGGPWTPLGSEPDASLASTFH